MQALQSISKRILAALTMFTRLPLWRLCTIEAEYYKQVVPLWPLAGWFTGGLMVGICLLCQWVGVPVGTCVASSSMTAKCCCSCVGVPVGTCVALCLAGRILLTGALHEDGFADFCDGFGGGTSRDAVLRIMKDSHIGTYGVLGLVMYYLIIWNILTTVLGEMESAMVLLVADSFCKLVSSSIIWFLPYARKESEAKILTVYSRPSLMEVCGSMVFGLLPMCLFFSTSFIIPAVASAIVALLLFAYMRHRIQGYTGDCCGATFIITEAVFYLSLVINGNI